MSGRGRGRGRGGGSGSRAILQQAAKEAGVDLKKSKTVDDITNPKLFPDFEWHSSGRRLTEGLPQVNGPTGSGSTTVTKAVVPMLATSSAQSSSGGGGGTRSWAGVTAALISSSREIPQQFQASPFFVLPRIEPDVVRYGKRPRPLEADALLVEYIGNNVARSPYFPSELLQNGDSADNDGSKSSIKPGRSKRRKSLDELAAEETAHEKTKNSGGAAPNTTISTTTGGEDADQLANFGDVEQEHEEEGDVDYTQNYYASEEDSDVGDIGGEEAVF
mmetsp:Transcript_47556/g.115865  ORF Transcript_47556/g.115865 Transcript_47556/m.115865 type:complete len:275 (-) Transcript_47556:391-1215(-)